MRLTKRLRSLFGRSAQEHNLDDELRFHIQMKADENIAAGMSPEEARYAALRAFGNPGLKREETRATWGWTWLEHLGQDLRYGLRALRQNRGFTAVAVLSLALGIGANTAIFSLIDAVLLRSLPVSDPQRLVAMSWAAQGWPDAFDGLAGNLYQDKAGRTTSPSFSYTTYERILARNHVFSNVLGLAGNGSEFNVGYRGEPARAEGELVSGTFFDTLGVQPALGRMLTPGDDRTESDSVAVISYGYWDRRFGRDPAILGKTITLNSAPFVVVGVCPPEFFGVQPGRSVDVWVALHQQPRVEPRWSPQPEAGEQAGAASRPPNSVFEQTRGWWIVMMARLKPGVSEQQARAEAEVILQQKHRSGRQGWNQAREHSAPRNDARKHGAGQPSTPILQASGDSDDDGRTCSPDRVRQCREPVAGSRHVAPKRDGGAAGHRRREKPPHPAIAHRERLAGGVRWSAGTGAGFLEHESADGFHVQRTRSPQSLGQP